ncbi:bifunctional protein tyrosine phosphatase family protein/NAD(P)/FAD-dependent oxidoreductase [Craurococcus roseus]|uniref:Bifunctional protein tyrosine phosphatase family protein/NAD(P)/FAD-dependent oxidoreductase n=1 Tax=Craurococcus roseus TaxID=77585 RepID=A0ABP3Q377_9PROT
MDRVARLTPFLSITSQISEADVGVAAARGFRAIVSNRPDDEAPDQPPSAAIAAAAERHGLAYRHIPVVSGNVTDADVRAFAAGLAELRGPVLAFCRTGTRSATLWALSEGARLAADAVLRTAAETGYDLGGLRPRLETRWRAGGADAARLPSATYDVLIVGGGAAGIAAAASLLKRRPGLDIAVVEPSDRHHYQPGWTLVGGGAFDRRRTERPMAAVMPRGVRWVRAAAAAFEPERAAVVLEDGTRLFYRALVVAPGLKLDWDAVDGLRATLGKNGVTSNYLFDLAPYTWQLVQALERGRALFTQPPMPTKCAGAPQKAMYLSCSAWERRGALKHIDVHFHTAGAVLFGVKEFVPPLMRYVERYGAKLDFSSNLKAVAGPGRRAWFEEKDAGGGTRTVERGFDMLHACPPQTAPDFVRNGPLADAAGWAEWTTRRCSTRATATSSASATPARRPMPRPRRRCASRRRSWPRTCWRRWTGAARARSTTATARAR